MNYLLAFKCDYPAVFTINGSFNEAKRALTFRRDEVYFITIFPLSSALMPYTVKATGAKVCNNDDLAIISELKRNEYLLRFLPRYSYVFAPTKKVDYDEDDVVIRFFKAVKSENISGARALLSSSLSSSVNDDALYGFFDGFDDVYLSQDGYYLIDSSGKSHSYAFTLKNNLIDDVCEKT